LDFLPPGVKDCGEANSGTKVSLVTGDLLESFRRGLKKDGEKAALVEEHNGLQLVGERKDDVEVGDGQETLLLLVEPFGLLQALAFGTVSVPAGVV
jgi:hypothetical protein